MSNFAIFGLTEGKGLTDSLGSKLVFNQVNDDLGQVCLNEVVACAGQKVSENIANSTNSFNGSLNCFRAGNECINFSNNKNTEVTSEGLGQL